MRAAGEWKSIRLWAAAAACLAAAGAAAADDTPAEKPPRLEFRALANGKDDADAFEAATKLLVDPKRKDDLQKLAEAGKPPPAPGGCGGRGPGLRLGGGRAGDAARWALRLHQERGGARDATGPVVARGGALLYARPCRDANLSKEEREAKGYDHFLLSRLPEKGKTVAGALVEEAKQGKDAGGQPCIDIVLSREGGEWMRALTSRNQDRPLGVLIDGRMASAPVVRSVIGAQVEITGDFTAKEIQALVDALCADIPTKDK